MVPPQNSPSQLVLMVVVPSEDAHQSEYVCAADKRREFISGAGHSVFLWH